MAAPVPVPGDARPTSSELLEFLLQQAQVEYINGSYQEHECGYQLKRRVLPDYNMIYVLRGSLEWVWDTTPMRLDPDTWTLVPRGMWNQARSLTRRITLMSYHLEMTLPGGRDLLEMLQLPMRLATSRYSRLAQMVRLSRHEHERPSTTVARSMLAHWAQLILRESVREAAAQCQLAISQVHPVVVDTVQWMREHLSQPVTLATLQSVSGYSAQHLNRLFVESLDITAMQYLHKLRMQRAASLLREGRLSIAAVGRSVGFDNPFYFSRVFRGSYQLSPRQWQQRQCSDNPNPG